MRSRVGGCSAVGFVAPQVEYGCRGSPNGLLGQIGVGTPFWLLFGCHLGTHVRAHVGTHFGVILGAMLGVISGSFYDHLGGDLGSLS